MSTTIPRCALPVLFALLLMVFGVATPAQGQATDLFFSEYIEGSSLNKALEIYNGTGATVDLAAGGYQIEMYFNGSSSAGTTVVLTGAVAAGDVYVVADDGADAAILAATDQTSTSSFFNGDDAIVLRKGGSGGAIVDVIGEVGFDPGSEWSGGGIGTQDETLRRMATTCAGDTDPGDAFDPSVEWVGFANNTFDGLGAHTAACGGPPPTPMLVISEIMYNPASPEDNWEWIEVYNNGTAPVNLSGFVVDDINSVAHAAANIASGSIGAGETGILYNADDVTAADFEAAWGPGINLIAVTGWSALALNNSGDQIGIWDSFASYDGDNTTHANVIAGVDYDDGAPWPSDDGNGSVYLTDLSADPNDGANWALSSDGAVTPTFDAYTSEAAGGNSGSDVGSPGPGPVETTLVINEIHADPDTGSGDANGDGTPNFSEDEFVEIVNTTTADIDLTGWTISDAVGVRHTFAAGSIVTAECAVVVFGGGSPSGGFGQATVQTASSNALGLNNGGDTVTLSDAASNVVATYTYGGEGGDNQSLTRDPDITGGEPLVKHSTATGTGGALFSPGTQIDGTNFSGCADDPPPSIAEIYEIQGSGAASPFVGQTVTTEDNVVTATAPNGFFMQTPAARSDHDGDTSDGIFVFTGSAPGVAVGDLVDVTGEVVEFFDFTEFSNGPTVTVVGAGSLPAPIVFDSMTPSPDPTAPSCAIEFECYEGMLIQITGGAVGGPNQFFGTDPIAEVHIVADGSRPFREPGIEYPGMSGLPVWDGNPEVFELDPNKLGLPNQIIPAGSSFDAVGVLGYEFGGYELWPSSLTVTPAVIPEPVRPVAAGESTVGSLNLFRLFDDVDDPADSQGRDDAVVSAAEYQRRLDKFSLYIRHILGSPDILAVQEAEKLGVLQDLAAEIQADDPTVTYAAYLIEGNDIGTIDVGFLIRTDRVQVNAVTQLGASETFIDPTDNSVDILHDRPPLLLEGAFTGVSSQPQPIAVMVLHMRSLSGIETSARVRRKRLEQAQSVAQKVQDFQTANPNIGLVVTGDFNAFEFTDGYVHLVGRIQGDFDDTQDLETGPDLVNPNLTNRVLDLAPVERYSFVFNGTAQVLDHALTTSVLDGAVTGFDYGRGNADAAEVLLDDPATPLRASDHDGLVLFLDVAPPEITVAEEPIVLDPPNHSYHTISVTDFVTGVTEATLSDIYIVSVSSDEEENGNGDGNTTDDIVIADCQSVDLRAERQGSGNGRVYTITVAASDAAGNVGTASFEVWVPKGNKKPAINDGAAYSIASGCSAPAANASVAEANGDVLDAATLEETPSEYVLAANYPNPFNPATTIEFGLPEAATVRLTVYDVTGREVARLVEGSVSAGQHRVVFDARSLPSGVYFYRLTAPGFTQTQRMVLMK